LTLEQQGMELCSLIADDAKEDFNVMATMYLLIEFCHVNSV
jgi:hypothetical protein